MAIEFSQDAQLPRGSGFFSHSQGSPNAAAHLLFLSWSWIRLDWTSILQLGAVAMELGIMTHMCKKEQQKGNEGHLTTSFPLSHYNPFQPQIPFQNRRPR